MARKTISILMAMAILFAISGATQPAYASGWGDVPTKPITIPTDQMKGLTSASAPGLSGLATKNINVYSQSSLSSKIGAIYAGDMVEVATKSSNSAYVTYPVSGGTKSGYISVSDMNSFIKFPNLVDAKLPSGYYTIRIDVIGETKIEGSFYADIANGSGANGAALQLWNQNGSPAQLFYFNRMNDGSYLIKTIASEMANQSEPRYLSVNSSSNSGANVQQWSLKSGDASQY
ncbi:MAG: RICIN domain-containing protein, partial [Clostridiales bacterium]|nr:RICIN domain-containing protein [Clostridiales bacterium]